MKVVHEPVVDHHVCGPGWVWSEERPFDPTTMAIPDPPTGYKWHAPGFDVPVGRVVECDCGQTWVCVRDPGYETPTIVVMPHNEWRKETARERRRRERRARR